MPNVSYEENSSKSDGVVIYQNITPGKTVKEGTEVGIVINKQPVKATVTVNVNLQSLTGYIAPQPVVNNTVTNTIGNTVDNNTVTEPVVPEIEEATVVIEVGDDTILRDSYPMTKTDITKDWTTSGVKEVKVKVNGVTKFTQTVDFNRGNQVISVN